MQRSTHKIDSGVYRSVPQIVEAFQYDGDFMDSQGHWYIPEWAVYAHNAGVLYFEGDILIVSTMEGNVVANPSDYIVKQKDGSLFVCHEKDFKQFYVKV